MSVAEMKKIILEKIEHTNNEKSLEKVLGILNADELIDKPIDATKYMEKLFSENDGLLKRLA